MLKLTSVRLLSGALALFALLTVTPAAFAQTSGSATLRGTVKDAAGAIVPASTVTITSNRTSAERKITTGNEGTFTFPSLDPGTYTLKVEAANFKTYVQTDLVLSPSDTRGADVTLEPGGASETVTVTAESITQIQTETGEKSNTITAAQIENLSLVGRSSIELLRILPGVVAPDATDLQIVGFGSGANNTGAYSVNGLRGTNNNVSIDGSRVIDIGSNSGTIITPNNDMVQEVKVQTSNYAAEYGSSGVQITATTKGGSNDYHGTLYTYARPYQLQANERQRVLQGFFPNGELKSPRPETKFYYPGGNIGGPVAFPRFGEGGPLIYSGKDKLFFFFGFEVQRQLTDSGVKNGVVPTLKQRQGDYSEFFPGGLYNNSVLKPDGTYTDPTGITLNQAGRVKIGDVEIPGAITVPKNCTVNGIEAGQFAPGNNIAPCIDPIGRSILGLYPLPNFTPTSDRAFNYISNSLSPINRIDAKARFDYKVNDNTNIYVRLARETETNDNAFGIWWGPSTYELPSHNLGTNSGRSAAVNVTSVLNPTMTNELVFSASKLELNNTYAEPEKVSLGALGIDNFQLPFGRATNFPPAIHNWGNNGSDLWSGLSGENIFAYNSSISVTDNLTKIFNSHTFKFGGLIEQANKEQNFQGREEGAIILGASWNQNATRSDFGDLLVGRPVQVNNSTVSPVGQFRFYNIEGYAQDSWKLRPNFTLEYGMRVAYLPNNKERSGLDTLFDPNSYIRGAGAFINGDPTQPNGLLIARRGQIPQGSVPNNAPQLAPRVNFAWDVNGNGSFVLRGGGGLFYNRVQGNFQYDPALRNPPFGIYEAAFDTFESAGVYTDNIADFTLSRLGKLRPYSQLGGYAPIVPDQTSYNIPRIANFSLSLARRLPFGNVLEVAYVGTQGRHLPSRINKNVVPLGALNNRTVVDPGCTNDCGSGGPRAPQTLDMSSLIQRAAISGDILTTLRPFPDLGDIVYRQFTGTSTYHSLQATLSRQVGQRLTYFANYTFSKALGTLGGEFSDLNPIDTRGRSYGVLDTDRTHIFNISYNYNVPDIARGGFRNFLTSGVLNGWQLSGISSYQSGTPIRLKLLGAANSTQLAQGYFGTTALNTGNGVGGIAPVFTSNPYIGGGSKVDDKLLDISAITFPGAGQTGPSVAPFYFRAPNRNNHDLSFFKNFKFDQDGTKRLQFRLGLFNIFNQAFARSIDNNDPNNLNNNDLDLRLNTECVNEVTTLNGGPIRNGVGGTVDRVCDPNAGFRFTSDTIRDFGKIRTLRGRRIVEVALKFYF